MFALHPRLVADTRPLAETPRSLVRYLDDQRFPWVVVVPKVEGLREWHHLVREAQHALLDEVHALASALEEATGAEKMNLGALGNLVPQLHIHVVARFAADAAWPGPVWGSGAAIPWGAGQEPPWVDALRRGIAAAK